MAYAAGLADAYPNQVVIHPSSDNAARLDFAPFVTEPSHIYACRPASLLEVGAGVSVLEALEASGRSIVGSCRKGVCGTCEVRVLEGTPEHLDSVMGDEEKDELGSFTPVFRERPVRRSCSKLAAGSPVGESAPRTRAPESPQHKERLEQQPDASSDVAHETEGIGAGHKLRNVAGENRHEKRCREPTDCHSETAQDDEPKPQRDLHDSGCHNDKVRVERHPRRHLRLKLGPSPGEVHSPGKNQSSAEQPSGDGAGEVSLFRCFRVFAHCPSLASGAIWRAGV
jgi:ferredoxin